MIIIAAANLALPVQTLLRQFFLKLMLILLIMFKSFYLGAPEKVIVSD